MLTLTNVIPRNAHLRMVITFIGLLGLLNGLYQVERRVSGELLDRPFTSLVTGVSAAVAELLMPFPVARHGLNVIGSDHASVVIVSGCNGLEAMFLMIAGILAYPATWRRRGRALATYLPALFGLNLLRIVMLLFVMVEYPSMIDFFHSVVAQGILVAFVIGFWIQYVRSADEDTGWLAGDGSA